MINTFRRLANSRYRLLPSVLLHGPEVAKNYRRLLKSQTWSADHLAACQLAALRKLVSHAWHNSPFYHDRFRSIGLEPGDIRSFEDYRRIPCLTKDDLRYHLDTLQVRQLHRYRPVLTRTGGTTGAPVTLYRSQNTAAMRLAIEWRNYAWAGHDYRQKKMSLFPGTSADIGKEPYFEDPKHRMLVVKTFEAEAGRFELFRRLYRQYQPAFLTGIVEFYRMLGRYFERHGGCDINTPALFVQGETVTAEDRRNFKQWFGAEVFDYYGMRENVVSAAECLHHTMHINQEFVYQEFETENGQSAEDGELAEIIGTSLHNYAVPLIRYRTGDVGCRVKTACPCGRKHEAMAITGGRTRDFITAGNKLIYICHHTSYLLDLSAGVEALQFYQPDTESLEIRIVRNDRFVRDDADKLIGAVRDLTGGKLRVSLRFVEEIPRTRVGKYRFVISDVPTPF